MLYYIIISILENQKIFVFFSGDVYLSLHISLSSPIFSSFFIDELLCGDLFETCNSISAISFPTKSPVATAVFQIALFETVLIAPVLNF